MASKRVVKAIIFLAVFGAFIVATYETFFWFTHVYENDARVETDLSQLSSQVNGKIEKILVTEGQSVKIGEPLVKLVDSDISLKIKALKTDLDLKKAEKLKLISEKIAFETELSSKLKTQNQKIKTIKMEQNAVEDRLELAKKNIKRVEFLFQKELVAEEKMNLEKDKFLVLKGDLAIKSAQIAVAVLSTQPVKGVTFDELTVDGIDFPPSAGDHTSKQTEIEAATKLEEIISEYNLNPDMYFTNGKKLIVMKNFHDFFKI